MVAPEPRRSQERWRLMSACSGGFYRAGAGVPTADSGGDAETPNHAVQNERQSEDGPRVTEQGEHGIEQRETEDEFKGPK